MNKRRPLFIAGCGLFLLLAVIAWWRFHHGKTAATDARPALWQIEKDGRRAWLFGTIHAVPRDARWMTPAVTRAAQESGWLWLEVTGLDAERRSQAIFQQLGQSPNLPPLAARLGPQAQAALSALDRKDRWLVHGLDGYESWAAALLITSRNSSASSFSSRNGGEALLGALFTREDKPVAGLETISGQLGFFDRLPEAAQQDLLAQAVSDAKDAEAQLTLLYRDWASGDIDAVARLFEDGIGKSPTLRRVLVDERNARWANQIDAIMARHSSVPFIAVGAGHLVGPNNLRDRLAAAGWTIKRAQ